MTRPPTAPAGQTTHRFPTLEARYGALTPMDSGMQSRIYATADGQCVVKVYRNQRGEHRLEAENMRRAGMDQWIRAVAEADGVEALVLGRFPGHPLRAGDVPRALPRLRERLADLHARQQGEVNVAKHRERLGRFASALSSHGTADLFGEVESALDSGLLDRPASFCHLDLWHDNILISGTGDVLVIDWNKAGWDDPLRDLALLKTGTLDLMPADASLDAALSFLPDRSPETLRRYRAYLALTTLHDLYWFLMNEPYEFDTQKARKLRRARHALSHLPG